MWDCFESSVYETEKKMAEKRGLDNRIDALAKKDAFITLKDHNRELS